jgi:nucleoside 2-deoxyribosyltransferase
MKNSRFQNENHNSGISVAICGSYNKHLSQIARYVEECRSLGMKVTIPKYAVRKYSTHGFVYLKGEKGTPRKLQDNNFRAIANSTFLLVVNPEGYIGPSTSLEVGYAYANDVPVFLTHTPRDYVFRFFSSSGMPLEEIKARMENGGRKLAHVSDL